MPLLLRFFRAGGAVRARPSSARARRAETPGRPRVSCRCGSPDVRSARSNVAVEGGQMTPAPLAFRSASFRSSSAIKLAATGSSGLGQLGHPLHHHLGVSQLAKTAEERLGQTLHLPSTRDPDRPTENRRPSSGSAGWPRAGRAPDRQQSRRWPCRIPPIHVEPNRRALTFFSWDWEPGSIRKEPIEFIPRVAARVTA